MSLQFEETGRGRYVAHGLGVSRMFVLQLTLHKPLTVNPVRKQAASIVLSVKRFVYAPSASGVGDR